MFLQGHPRGNFVSRTGTSRDSIFSLLCFMKNAQSLCRLLELIWIKKRPKVLEIDFWQATIVSVNWERIFLARYFVVLFLPCVFWQPLKRGPEMNFMVIRTETAICDVSSNLLLTASTNEMYKWTNEWMTTIITGPSNMYGKRCLAQTWACDMYLSKVIASVTLVIYKHLYMQPEYLSNCMHAWAMGDQGCAAAPLRPYWGGLLGATRGGEILTPLYNREPHSTAAATTLSILIVRQPPSNSFFFTFHFYIESASVTWWQ